MAEIPDAQNLGSRTIPGARTRIQSDRSGEILGAGVEDLGRSLARGQARKAAFLEREQAETNRFNYAKARSILIQSDVAARAAFDDDQDPATMEKRYRELVQKDRDKAAALITDPREREMFSMDADADLERGALAVRGQARSLDRDQGRAVVESTLAKNREAALMARDPGTRAALVESTIAMLDGATKPSALGAVYFSKEEAAERGRAWAQDYGEGAVDLLPPEQQLAMLAKPDGTPAQYIPADRRAAFMDRATNEMRRREAEARARQGEVRQALNDAEDDALAARAAGIPSQLPSRGLYSVAYGDDGAKRYGLAAQRMATFDAVDSVILMRPDQALTELAKFKPTQQEGAADQSLVQRQAVALYEHRRQAFEQDPVGYLVGSDPRVQELLPGIVNGTASREDVSAYLSRVRSVQDQAGVVKPKILPEQAVDAYVKALAPNAEQPGARAASLAAIEKVWGKHYGEFLREVAPKLEGVGGILPFVPPRVAARLDSVASNPSATLDVLKRSGRQKDLDAALGDELAAFDATFPGGIVADGPAISAQYYDAAKLLAADYMRTGTTPEKAAKQAVDEIVRTQYDTQGALRVPKREDGGRGREIDTGNVLQGTAASILTLAQTGKFDAKPTRFETAEAAQEDRRAEVAQFGSWVTNDDETGAVLTLPSGVVLGGNGKPIEMTWPELEEAGRQAAQDRRKSTDLDITRRYGFGGPR